MSDKKYELPKCGRLQFFNDGRYIRCQTPVISSVIPCPECKRREQEYDEK